MKLMTIRLGHVLLKVISLSQSGFVPGRLFTDNVLLAQVLVHSLEFRRPDANAVFKLDMAKAYDRVSWEFLYQVLRRKGFPQRWIGLVANAILHCWFSVLVNGEHAGFFHSTRGLRQGDPLSPALFVVAADYLSRGLDRLFAAHPTMFYQLPGLIRVSHLAYADDLMIFTTTCRQNMELLRDFLRAYERVSGQLINGSKSSFIVGRQASSLQTQAVQDVLGYQLKHLPVTYLGVPLYKGNRKACYSVASALGDSPPKSVLITIERIFNGFFWGSYNGRSVSFWHDNWLGEKPLAQLLYRDTYTMEPQARGIKLCGQGLVRGISRRNRHGKLFDKLHLDGSYLQMSGTVPCGQLFQFSCGGFFKIEFQWTHECDKRGSVFHLNVSAVRQRRLPICLLRARQCKACGSTLLPFLGSTSVYGSLTHIWCTSAIFTPFPLGSPHSGADTFPNPLVYMDAQECCEVSWGTVLDRWHYS
ncbi:putative mitochondrial protein [Sesamum angolense]|uniref:Mitochondrial protein n=1 Tax=Sesamum angolense TaxID=2727404 RepID=A0AAE1T6M7_9LAMI|nr:putative mitochondrial protein [Sesamum angolense]